MTKPLSPATAAVLAAYYSEIPMTGSNRLAAALRAAADQVLIRLGIPSSEYSLLMQMIDRDFRAIAAELEAQHD